MAWNNADWDLYIKSAKSNASAYQKMYKDQEEQRQKDEAAKAQQKLIDDAVANGQLNKDGSEKSAMDKVGDIAKAAPGAIWDGITSSYKRIGEGTAEVIGEVTGANQTIRDNYAKMQQDQIDTIKTAGQKLKDPNVSDEEKARWKALLDKTAKDDTPFKESQAYNEQQIEKTDPVKAAAAMGSIGLDVITAGTAGVVLKSGRAALKTGQLATKANQAANVVKAAETASKASKSGKVLNTLDKITNPNGIKQSMASGATLGAAYGPLGALETNGSDTTAGDILTGTALGVVGGGVLGGVVGGIGKGISKLLEAKDPKAIQEATQAIVDEAKQKADAPKQLGAGYRDPAEIEADIKAVQDGTDDSLFTYTDTAGNDVTSQVGQFDKEISARKAAIRDLQQQADGIDNNTGEATIPEGVDPSTYTGDATGRANASEAISKLQTEIQDLTDQQSKAFDSVGGVQKTLNNDAAKEKFASLQDELATSTDYQNNVKSANNREAAQAIDVNALNKEEADLKAGIVPDEMMKPFAAAKSVDDVQAMMRDVDPQDTKGFIQGGHEINQERMYLDTKMEKLFTKDKYDGEVAMINNSYKNAADEIAQLPPPVQAARMEELNAQVLQQFDDLDARLAKDAPDVEDVTRRLAEQDTLEQAMVHDARAVQLSDPELFRPVDNAKVAQRLEEIKHQKFLASEAPNPLESKQVLTQVVDNGGSIVEEAKTNDAVAKAVDKQVETHAVSALDNTGKTAGLGWLVGTPTRVMEKFGPAGKQVADILRGAVEHKEQLDGAFEYQMGNWGKLIKGKESTEAVARALDGQEGALEKLNGSQKQAYQEIKQWFADQADQLGLPQDARVQDYLPHLFDGKNLDSVERTLAQLRSGKLDGKPLTQAQMKEMEDSLSGIDANTLAYLASKNNYIAKNGFLKKRKGAKDYSLDLEKIMTAYHNAASTDIAYKPAIASANDITPALTREQNNYVSAVFKSLQGETDTVIEKSIDGALQNLSQLTGKNFGGEGTVSRLSRGTRSAIYNATIGANVGSAIRNTQQMVNVYAEVGGKAVLEAAPRALAALKKDSPMREMLYRNGVLSNRQGSYLQGGAMPSFKDKSTKLLWGMFNTTETLNRATAFFAGYDKHLAKFPNDLAGAEKAGAAMSKKTNFKFSAIDIPVAMQGDMAKNFLQMQTYNVQQSHFILEMLGEAGNLKKVFTKGPDGKFTMNAEPQLKLARFLGGNAAFFGTVGAATGMDWKEAVPFLNDAQNSEVPRSPMTQILFGDNKGQPGLVNTVKSGATSLFTGKWDDAAKDADAFARGAFRTLAPGGNQIVKSVEGVSSAVSGVSTTGSGLIGGTLDKGISAATGTTPSGNVRFSQGDDAWSKFKASVLGQYSTQAGRDWVDEGMKNVPTNLKIDGMDGSAYIKSLPRETQEQYVGYYSTKAAATEQLKNSAGTKTDSRAKIVDGLKDGSLSETDAIKMADEYNKQVIDAMVPFLAGNQKIPSRLMNDLTKNMLIDVQSAISSSKRTKSLESLQESLSFTVDDMGE